MTQNVPFLIEIFLSLYCFMVEFQSLNRVSKSADLIYRPTGLKFHLLAHGLISEKLFFSKNGQKQPFFSYKPMGFYARLYGTSYHKFCILTINYMRSNNFINH